MQMPNELTGGFDAELFCGMVNEKFSGSFSRSEKNLPLKEEFPWEEARQLGIIKTLAGPNGSNMPLLVVAAKLHDGETLKERSSRIRQFKFAKEVLNDAISNPAPGVEGLLSQGLFVFHDEHGNFRLSLVYGKAEGSKLVWSTAKRLSFYVEAGQPNKTFRDRMKLPWGSFDQLKDAFSVEKLTKEFYNRLFGWYQWALSDEMNVTYPNNTDTPDDDREINEHIIRLITRLMFVWFLKQKHLVPDTLFDTAELKKVLKNFDPLKGDNYYRAILQNLFFATLNSEIPERAFAVDAGNIKENKEHFDIKTLYRYSGEFSISQDAVLKLFEKIPFLNGGLFECLDRGKNYSDGFSRNTRQQARLPNRLFFDPDKGLIPLLSQYNFTVEENSPGDEEVALDPEMLGKVFENLLGAYNPETQVAARNATGSFYTPREIVNYMVDESLIAYLKNALAKKNTKRHENGNEQKVAKNAKDSNLCGLGDLEAEGRVLDDVEEKLRLLFAGAEGNPFSKEETAILDEVLVTAKILDPACGSGAFPMGILLRMVELLRILRNLPEDQSVYDLKLELIENCIYGGDIQCIAVQISKLRFFISLVCEQKPTASAKDNYGIHTLPNLETKFVAADSLIGLPKSGSELPMKNVETMKKELWAVRHKHFLARTYQEKKNLRKEDKILREKLAKALEQGGGFDTASARLMAAWDPYEQNTSAAFSDPEWMFNVKDGFDVVIGNPPYGAKIDKAVISQQGYQLICAETAILFVERGQQLLKKFGVQSYIIPKAFCFASNYKKARNFVVPHLVLLADCGKAFENVLLEACIFLARIEPIRNGYTSTLFRDGAFVDMGFIPSSIVNDFGLLPNGLTHESIEVGLKAISSGRPLCNYVKNVRGGAFQQMVTAKGEYAVVGGKEINKYGICGEKGRIKKSSVNRSNGLISERSVLAQNIVAHITNPYPQIKIIACIPDQRDCVITDTINQFAITTDNLSQQALWAILNSKLICWFAYNFLYGRAIRTMHFDSVITDRIPVAQRVLENVSLSHLVDRILAAKKSDPAADTSALESEIDELVYDLYGLTEEEKAIVRASGAQKPEDSGQKTEDRSRETAVSSQKPEVSKPKRGRKAQLPPSLPGWD